MGMGNILDALVSLFDNENDTNIHEKNELLRKSGDNIESMAEELSKGKVLPYSRSKDGRDSVRKALKSGVQEQGNKEGKVLPYSRSKDGRDSVCKAKERED